VKTNQPENSESVMANEPQRAVSMHLIEKKRTGYCLAQRRNEFVINVEIQKKSEEERKQGVAGGRSSGFLSEEMTSRKGKVRL